jgi:integrase
MAYIIQRKDRFYVVAYDGLDPLTGKERRRWHPAGHDRHEAEQMATRIEADAAGSAPLRGGPVHLGEFLTDTWLPTKRRHVRATTSYRYSWMVDNYVNPSVGHVPLRRLRADHLDGLYDQLATTGGRHGTGLAPKTVHEVHVIVRSSLDLAMRRQLVDTNVAQATNARHKRQTRKVPRSWTAEELASFLAAARPHRLHPALHLTACTGMRRGEVAGLKWSDLDRANQRLSISRTLQSLAGQPVEFPVKTRTSRRCIDLDDKTMDVLARWRRRLSRDGLPHDADDWMFVNPSGRFVNPESISQLFGRLQGGLPELTRIRFHDLRHTHASLLIMDGVPVKVVSERLGHANVAFTMHTYQHLLPGMSAAAARQFAALLAAHSR